MRLSKGVLIGLGLMCLISPGIVLAWPSDSGGSAVSANDNVVRSSLEATALLQSDSVSNLYGLTRLGGASNNASVDSNGVYSTRNVTGTDVINLKYNQFAAWLSLAGDVKRIGLSTDGVFSIGDNTRISGYLTSNSVISQAAAFGNYSVVVTNSGKTIFPGNRPKRTIVLTAGGASAIGASASADTLTTTGSNIKQNRLVFSPFSVQDAEWSFVIPNSFVGTSVDVDVVWYSGSLDTGAVSFDVQTTKLSDSGSYLTTTWGAYGSVTDTYVASGNSMKTSSFVVPVTWASGDLAVVRLQKNSTDAGDTVSHDVNVVALRMAYEAQTLSD